MKRLLSYLFVAMALLSCLRQPEPIPEPQLLPFSFDGELLALDSLMQHDADSALVCLTSFRPTEGSGEISSTFNANYQSLLLSEALFKTDNPQYYRNELQMAMRYFDTLAMQHPDNDDIVILSARSHYMNGVGYYENDSVVDACKEYLHALEIMEDHFEEEELVGYKAKFMGMTYTRLGEVFCNHATSQASIEAYHNAIKYLSRVGNFSLANAYKNIGNSYVIANNNDSAVFYFRKSMMLAKRQNKITTYSWVLSQAAPIYYDIGYKDSAFIMINKALDLASNEDNRLTCCYVYGSLLFSECKYDSAVYYLTQSINRNQFATKAVSAELLMKCYMALNDTVNMQYYKNIYGEKLDKYRGILTIEDELANIYTSYQQDKLNKKLLLNVKKRNRNIIIYSSICIAVLVGFILIVRKRISDVNDDIIAKNLAITELKRKIEANPFINEPICKSILEIANKQHFKSKVPCTTYKQYALNKEQLLALKEAIDRHYDNFTQWISKEFPELTTEDVTYCCLYYLGLKDADISAMMQRAYPTISERSRKLKRIFNSDEPLYIIIKNIIDTHGITDAN